MFDWRKPPVEVIVLDPVYARRLACAVFKVKDGIIFVDVGYEDSSFHPFHLVKGELWWDEANDQWVCGGARIRRPSPGIIREYEQWAKEHPESASPEAIKELIVASGLVDSKEELS